MRNISWCGLGDFLSMEENQDSSCVSSLYAKLSTVAAKGGSKAKLLMHHIQHHSHCLKVMWQNHVILYRKNVTFKFRSFRDEWIHQHYDE